MSYAIAYLATAVVFFAIDYVWLTRIAGSFYRDRVGALMAKAAARKRGKRQKY